ncbi:hypothetical protein MHN80_02255 [Gordonia McavH-238-E]|uniref:hypothetical protein n=1 Tax=Gordonia sp. McavH-238-E TaxID=2917736 RepID=UPI001EF41DD3|nr:hypothetical protein [Gordonia sp. McavH-238-E]MCG7631126.1 hypothetical protein [Gordonia sp. McavH-238-E]
MTEQTMRPTVTVAPHQRTRVGATQRDVERLNEKVTREAGDRIAASSVIRPAPTSPPAPQQHPPAPGLDDAGDLGQTITDLIRLSKLADAGSRTRARIREEAATVAEQQRDAHQRHQRALIAEAWEAAAKRQRVPDVVERAMRFYEHERITASVDYARDEMLAAVDARHAELARAAVADVADEIDAEVLDAANGALRDALQAHERLRLAGVSVDVTLDEAVDAGDAGVIDALRLWRESCTRWGHVQNVRQWVAAVLDRGFVVKRGQVSVTPPPRIPSGAFADTAAVAAAHGTAERRTQGSQWEGSTAPRWLADKGSHEVLRWWVGLDEGSRLNPSGVRVGISSVVPMDQGSHKGAEQHTPDTDQVLNEDEAVEAW